MDRDLLRRVAGPGVPVLVAIVVAVLVGDASERLDRQPDALAYALAVGGPSRCGSAWEPSSSPSGR